MRTQARTRIRRYLSLTARLSSKGNESLAQHYRNLALSLL